MSPSENEGDTKKTGVRPEPLCLFCFPEDTSFAQGKTYVNTLPKEPSFRRAGGQEDNLKKLEDREREKKEFWLRKRTEARIRRRRMKEPIRNLKSYLLTSVKDEKVPSKVHLPSLFEVFETVKDAWPSPPSRNVIFYRQENKNKQESQNVAPNQKKMKDEQVNLQYSSQLLSRRLSVPEELMRKYSVSKERTSEDSETNKTTNEISPTSSSTLETARRNDADWTEPNVKVPKPGPQKTQRKTTDASQQTHDPDDEKVEQTDLPKRVTQSQYYSQGKQIIKVRTAEKNTCTCQREQESSTTASAKEETDESGTTESIPSSSPIQLPKKESSSGNVSSESDNIRCTCAELNSKETSTDLYISGKSTLSQTVSDKSISTQDSTVSINSVSTRGSTVSDNSNSTTPEIERTSAKETTTSPDYSPRTPRSRKNRRRDKYLGYYHDNNKTCPRYNEAKHSKTHLSVNNKVRQCPIHVENVPERPKLTANAATNTELQEDSKTQTTQTTETPSEVEESSQNKEVETSIQQEEKTEPQPPENQSNRAKLSQEELYMMQQLRHQKFIESYKKLSNVLPPSSNADSMTACGTGSFYKETECLDQPILIPRYSALPRSLSMLVNTSSPDTSHNSDSDNQSLADSLEDQPITHVHKLYFDTKKESKPVRGDVNIVQNSKPRVRQPRGRAFFVSIKQPYGEDEMLENIEKIPQPPEKIKNQIFERHLNLCAKHKHRHNLEEQKGKGEIVKKKKKTKNKNEESEKISKAKNHLEENKKLDRKSLSEKKKQDEDQKAQAELSESAVRRKKETKDSKGRFSSRIPVLLSSRSTSSSPERDSETRGRNQEDQKSGRPKTRLRREKEKEEPETIENPLKPREVETTQILEITQTGAEISLQKPQAVIHPSQIPLEAKSESQLTMPPLVNTLKLSPFRQTWNKQLLFATARRSPIGKFRQRFEVIPEEKSSSLSSAEEKNGRKGLSKFTDVSTNPLPSDKIQFHSYSVNEVPNLIVAKITNKQLETLPYVKGNDSRKIILFSSKPQNSNSSKGRDALIAMNREDFNRLARGWMNFYKLNENTENSESEDKAKEGKQHELPEMNERPKAQSSDNSKSETKTSQNVTNHEISKEKEKCLSEPKTVQEVPELGDNIKFDCSNTILRTVKHALPKDCDRSLQKENLSAESEPSSRRNCGIRKSVSYGSLKRVGRDSEDDSDSDSTDYMEPPSPRVPPLAIGDIPSDATLSSSDSEASPPKTQTSEPLQYPKFKKRGAANKARTRDSFTKASNFGKKDNSGWSVTVAGTVELSRSAPDLEMRLSFPADGGPPIVSQSDSGFVDDSNYSKLSESLQDLDSCTSKKLPMSLGNSNQKWMVTVKNPKQGKGKEFSKQQRLNNLKHHLPDLEPLRSRNSKKVLKGTQVEEKVKRLVEKKMQVIWPKVQQVIREEFLTESGRLIINLEDDLDEECLSVKGSAVSLEKKQKPPTMTERDVTRRSTSRLIEEGSAGRKVVETVD